MTPWNIDQRSMPSGTDTNTLCPMQVGPYMRTKIEGSPLGGGSAYVHYAAGAATIFMEFAIPGSLQNAHAVVETAAGETGGKPVGTDPRYFVTDDGTFFAWSRGGYYWSAHAQGGPGDLDAFMRAFPF
jgi:hypothetical protein